MRLALAITTALALVLSAPFIGQLRSWIARSVPDHFALMVNGVVGVSAIVVLAVAFRRIRSQRALRFGLVAVAAVIGVSYTRLTGSANPAVAAVEHFHFVQYGLITWLFYRVWQSARDASSLIVPFAAAFIVGTAEEWLQWFVPARVGELADVLLNAVAILCGLLIGAALDPPLPFSTRLNREGRRRVGVALTMALAALAWFIGIVHVGVQIHDPEIGTFKSRYDRDQLAAESVDRTRRWAARPPLTAPRFSREDQYLTEGHEHVRARNDAWEAGDVATAWGENLILERYFAPVLDTPSFVSETGHRWAPAHREDALKRHSALPPRAWVSHAEAYPIFVLR